ncbi:hypothetical protein ABZ519_41640 [Streptomyces collinus]|uniref:hypothetical protein n=1 Tax=Streptomyces collinus TaxID=42684 RepID=UPI00340BEA62
MAKIARLTGASLIRPVRLGIAFKPTLENVALAASWATKSWGGLYFPLLDSSQNTRSLSIAEGLDLDAIWPLDDHPDSKALARSTGFFWRSFGDSGPFDVPEDALPSSLLSPDWALSEDGSGPFIYPQWTDGDPLRDLFGVWFGTYENSSPLKSHFQRKGTSHRLELNERIPSGVVNFRTPVAATKLGVSYSGTDIRTGLVNIDVEDPQSLMLYWNLRATGANVFPWVSSRVHRLFHLFCDWFASNLASAPVRVSQGVQRSYMSLWGMAELPEIINRHTDGRCDWRVEDSFLRGGWNGPSPLSTPFNRTFSVQFDASDAKAAIPLPPGPPIRYASSNNVGIVAAHVSIYTESHFRPGVVATAPNLRAYSRLLDTMANYPGSFERVVHEGRAVSVAADAHEVEIGFTTSIRLLEKLFEASSWKVKHTEGGRLASRVIEMLGGVEQYSGNQPAIRRVLDDAAKSVAGRKIPALIQAANNHKGEWPGRVNRDPQNYAKNVVYGLLYRKLLQPFLEIKCPHCATRSTVRPEGLVSEMECEICSDRFPLGLALGIAPGGKNEWIYRLTGNLSADRIAEIMPVAATTSVLADLLSRGKGSLPHAYGIVLEEKGWKCEVDVAVLADGEERPFVILGEVKSYRDSIDENDLNNLIKVQDFLNSKGVGCFVLAATLREEFSEEEVADLRHACEVLDSSGGSLPIVLTGKQLSVPRLHPEYPASWDSRFSIPNFARESCERNLGLSDVRQAGHISWDATWDQVR